MNVAEAEDLVRQGVAALQRRDPQSALLKFETVVRSGVVAPPYILLAQACRMAGDQAGEVAALDNLLANQPRDIRALIMRGDCHARAGDDRAAISFYDTALRAAASVRQVPPSLAAELKRAEYLSKRAMENFDNALEAALHGRGMQTSTRSERFQESLDILRGRKQIFYQEPSSFYFSRLPQIPFYEREEFAWVSKVEEAFPDIKAELTAIIEAGTDFPAYIEGDPNRPQTLHQMLGDTSWSAFHLLKNGERVEPNVSQCPRTLEAIAHAPVPEIKSRSPMVLFSILKAGAHIPAHNGLLNTRLICHLPLIVPKGCRFRVGNEVREWEEGKLLIFDDSIEHEAWNDGDETRAILLFEIWRPEITMDERHALTAMFEAIVDYDAGALKESV